MSKRLNIGLMGTRGIPARYGGFETFAENLSRELTARGHSVSVYARHSWRSGLGTKSSEFEGVRVLSTPTVFHKYLETPLHALSSFLDARRRGFDCAVVCNAANSPFSFLLRLAKVPFVTNVDGIERLRAKWNKLGSLWYLIGERCAVWFSKRLVSDAHVIAAYYQEQYGCSSEVIAYGADFSSTEPGELLAKFDLTSRGYVLYVSRLEPENNALGVIQAYKLSGIEMPLVIVGDAPYADEYKRRLQEEASESVIFTGFQFGDAYRELLSNCAMYVQATEVGGTHPALVESMAVGNAVIANGTPENLEVLGDAGLHYQKNDFEELAGLLRGLSESDDDCDELRKKARERAESLYTWPRVTAQYEALLSQVSKN